jgi:hypothetical protein
MQLFLVEFSKEKEVELVKVIRGAVLHYPASGRKPEQCAESVPVIH